MAKSPEFLSAFEMAFFYLSAVLGFFKLLELKGNGTFNLKIPVKLWSGTLQSQQCLKHA